MRKQLRRTTYFSDSGRVQRIPHSLLTLGLTLQECHVPSRLGSGLVWFSKGAAPGVHSVHA